MFKIIKVNKTSATSNVNVYYYLRSKFADLSIMIDLNK